jgi:hypothetical protein
MLRTASRFALTVLLVAASCKNKEGAPAASDDNKPAAPAKLAKFGLTIEAGGEVSDGIGGDGYMIGTPSGAVVLVTAGKPHTLDEAKSDASMYNAKNLKAESLPDGWALTFDNTGPAGASFFVQVGRTLDGKPYRCETTAASAAQSAAVLAACKTLKKG